MHFMVDLANAWCTNPAGIPAYMQQEKRWNPWRSEWGGPENDKFRKVPYHHSLRYRASATRLADWTTFDKIKHIRKGASGLGFRLGDQYGGIDFDDCLDEKRQPKRWVKRWIDLLIRLGAYIEVSPSGTGLKAFGIVSVHLDFSTKRYVEDGAIELYTRDRYFTVTGDVFHAGSDEPALLDEVMEEIDAAYPKSNSERAELPDTPPEVTQQDREVAEKWIRDELPRALRSKKLSALWNDHGWDIDYDGRSEARLGLVSLVRRRFPEASSGALYEVLCRSPFIKEDVARTKWPRLAGREIAKVEVAPSASEDYKFTDLGNAERFVATTRQSLRYCSQLNTWLVWDGVRWRPDDDGAVMRAAKATVRDLYRQAASVEDDEGRQRLTKWATASESAQRQRSMVDLAKNEADAIVNVQKLDADPDLLGVRNGVIDLATGTLIDPDPDCFITKQAAVDFDPRAKCPIWRAFLTRIMDDDMEMVGYLQRALGYVLGGNTSEKVLFFMFGPGGNNGKSTLIETVGALMGDYARKTPAETFMSSKRSGGSASPERIALRGARLVIASELSDSQRFDEAFIKDVTGGVDKIAGRDLYKGMVEFKPEFKLWLYGNHRPMMRGDDAAAWRRVHLIPFEVSIPPAEQDRDLLRKLSAESAGILNWMLEGHAEWRRGGLRAPEKVVAATEQYRDDMDVLGQFLEERCTDLSSGRVELKILYAAYRNWCGASGIVRWMTKPKLAAILETRGYEKRAGGQNKQYIHGLTLHRDALTSGKD